MHANLTKRQTETLIGLANGMPYKAIATHLGVSVSTIDIYVAQLYEKLDIHCRVTAAHYALHHGLVRNKFAPIETK